MPINMFTALKGRGLANAKLPVPEDFKCEAPKGFVPENEPSSHDGHDYEGFAGGCTRIGCVNNKDNE